MPSFSYTAQDPEGKTVKGKFTAGSSAEVADYLVQKQLLPISIQETKGGDFSLKAMGQIQISFRKTIKPDELLAFSRNMSTMLGAGVPMIRALEELLIHVKTPIFKKVLTSVLDAVKSGKTLSQAMQEHKKIFPAIYVSAVTIGENSGNLDVVFLKLAEFLEMEERNRKRLSQTLRYPKMVMVALIIALSVINIFVIPAFKSMFSQYGAELPLPTRILMATSDFFVDYWYVLIIIAAAIYISFKYALKNEKIAFLWDMMKYKIPIMGPVIRKILLTRFVWGLSLMIKSGVSLPNALDLIATSTGNQFLEKKLYAIKDKIEIGETLAASIKSVSIFDPVTMQMLHIGDETGKIDDMLEKISQQYDAQTEYALKKFSDAIEPIILVIIAGFVLLLALGVFLPMWNMGKVVMKK